MLNSADEWEGQPSRSQTIAPAGVDKYLPKSGAWTIGGDAHNVVDNEVQRVTRRGDGSET